MNPYEEKSFPGGGALTKRDPSRIVSLRAQLKDGVENCENRVREYLRENASLIVTASVIACSAFGYGLFNFTLSIDEEVKSFDPGLEWLRQGRWGTYLLLKLFMPESLIPFLPILVSLFFLIVTCFILFSLIGGDRISKVTFLLLFLTFPSAAFFLIFNTFNFAVGVGLAATLLGFWSFNRFTETSRYRYLSCSVLLTTFAVSTYQSTLCVWLCAFVLHLFYKDVSGQATPKLARNMVVAALLLALSLILYKVIAIIFVRLCKSGASAYLDNFVGWTTGGFIPTMRRMGQYLRSHLTGRNFYGERTLLCIWPLTVYLVYRILHKKNLGKQSLGLLFLFALILAPFALSLALGSPLPARSLVALPLMIAGVGYVASLEATKPLKYLFLAGALFVALQNSFCNTRLFYANHLASQADRDLANRILARINELDVTYAGKKAVPLAIVGARGYSPNEAFIKSETFGSSFFEWEGGNPYRILFFIRLMGVECFKVADPKQYQAAFEESKNMKIWPNKGSVLYTGDMVIIKLSDITEAQMAQMRRSAH